MFIYILRRKITCHNLIRPLLFFKVLFLNCSYDYRKIWHSDNDYDWDGSRRKQICENRVVLEKL